MTLDEAIDAFREAPNAATARQLYMEAEAYTYDEMISEEERDKLFAETAPYLPPQYT